jgi:hypothetical protein
LPARGGQGCGQHGGYFQELKDAHNGRHKQRKSESEREREREREVKAKAQLLRALTIASSRRAGMSSVMAASTS